MNRTIFIMILMMVLTAACPSAKVMAQDQKPLIGYVQNLQMAEDILRPRAKQLLITRDPFKPIIPNPQTVLLGKKPAGAVVQDDLHDVRVIGIVRLDQEYRAYITVGGKTRVVNLQDTIRKYTITGIDMDEVILKSGNKEIIKKRGKL